MTANLPDLSASARLLAFFDSLIMLGEPTHAALSLATHPLAEKVLRIWIGSRDDIYADDYETAWGHCVAACRKDTHQALVHVYTGAGPTIGAVL